MKRKIKDLTGQRFGRWLVLRHVIRPQNVTTFRGAFFLCRCDCGSEVVVAGNSLTQQKSKSCGCLTMDAITSHGESGPIVSKEYMIWNGMKMRCQNPKDTAFDRYGGRGIRVCERWQKYENFLEDMGRCPSGLTLDRKNNDGNYEPGNCRWATRTEQQNNRKCNRLLTFNGITQTTANWARELNLPRNALELRLFHGWSVERTLTTPLRITSRSKTLCQAH